MKGTELLVDVPKDRDTKFQAPKWYRSLVYDTDLQGLPTKSKTR